MLPASPADRVGWAAQPPIAASTRRASGVRTDVLLQAAVWCAFLVVITFTSADPDLWGHLRFGMDIMHDGRIPNVDVYSFTSDRQWVNHEWAAEVIIAKTFVMGGVAGIVLLKLLIVGSVLLLLDVALRREDVHCRFTRDAIAGLAIAVTIGQAHHVRPQLFSVLAFAVLLSCLVEARRGSRRWLMVLPPLFAAWANLHGGWIVGGAVLALWTAAMLVGREYQLAMVGAAAGAVSLFATLLTPYGIGLWGFLQETVGFSRPDILEWQPVYRMDWPFIVLWLIAMTVTCVGLVAGGREHLRLERLAIGVALALASLKVARLLAFFGLAAVFFFAPAIGRAYQRRRAGRQPRAWSRIGQFGIATLAGSVAAVAILMAGRNFLHIRIDRRWMPEPQAVAMLNDQPAGRRILVWFNWGEYAIWHLSPRMKVSIDGRRETVYSEMVQSRHFDFFFDRPGGAALPGELAADYVWIPQTLPATDRLRHDPHWTQIYDGRQSAIFARAALRPATPVHVIAAADTTLQSFPGP